MDDPYTAENFSRNVNTKFHVNVDPAESIELELVRVEVRTSEPNEQGGMERFSAFFQGPPNYLLPQRTYELVHGQLGELQIFLVPIGQDERGYQYEAVFNRFKEASK
jgi:hypothetical protein